MERVRLVAFYVFPDSQGMRLEVSVRTDTAQVRCDHYGQLDLAELLCLVESSLDAVRPGDLIDPRGWQQPQLWTTG